MNKNSVGKRIVLDFIDYLRYKVERDALTLEEANSIASVLQKAVPGGANLTVADLPGVGVYLLYYDRFSDTLQLLNTAV